MFVAAKRLWAIVALSALMAACASAPKPLAQPMDFETAIRALTRNLLAQLNSNLPILASPDEITVAVEPMIDANTAEVTLASRRIDELVLDEARKQFPKIRLLPLNSKSAETAKYMLTGMIKPEPKGSADGPAIYHIRSAIVDLKTHRVAANADVRVIDPKLDATPISAFQDNPMYTKDKRADSLARIVETEPGQLADEGYMDGLTTAALMADGDRMYDGKNYEKALGFYREASLRPDGQAMRTYAAMYQAYRKLNRMEDAEVAFGRMIALGHSTNNMNIKLLFGVGSTQFIADYDLRSQYAIWLRQIARFFSKADSCLNIVGHSSRTGNEAYNESLSLQRAQTVRNLMQKDFPDIAAHSKATGRGWKENIAGLGSDDIRDAIDRRVEFRVIPCSSDAE
ncbi:MAG: hypothetical protein A3F73_05330 [Gallionellales bacterium RIFCSPLOWO2_12_FULL_59_22]|nr:MAG: hypothetical protein A3H99_00195 [Gallionellales bacterium RIFCSPLOWO2_02_FULL_59_110]OGT04844.1 MAG: hypothetical protein A2Z65_09025 [Gallionellales bacterium RIFCSPLOWO2_02_58_13]OGT12012.1 MAG: hypothetical protein A3F73_05330 [Gallionellales bacterium RIFCSPLOWO2_12_FULL_59_22]